jgi:hypothetical protein
LNAFVWKGEVEVFNIRGHPQARRAYAWAHLSGDKDDEKRYVTVLELPPVKSPETAVRAAIMSEIKNAREERFGVIHTIILSGPCRIFESESNRTIPQVNSAFRITRIIFDSAFWYGGKCTRGERNGKRREG